jgi:hypothetical protein
MIANESTRAVAEAAIAQAQAAAGKGPGRGFGGVVCHGFAGVPFRLANLRLPRCPRPARPAARNRWRNGGGC